MSPAVPPLKTLNATSLRPSRVKSKQIAVLTSFALTRIGLVASEGTVTFVDATAACAVARQETSPPAGPASASATRSATTSRSLHSASVEEERDRPLRRSELDSDPLAQFARWLEEAHAAGIELPEAATLATATRAGAPSARMVLLKDADERGLSFYTGYASRKGAELIENPRGALVFYWHALGRQVRVEGAVERVPDAESDAYFATRPPGSRLSAAVSAQSEVIGGREELEQAVEELRARSAEDVPRPPHWGGYRVVPDVWEFWQHRADRLHDRFRYRREAGSWVVERLAP